MNMKNKFCSLYLLSGLLILSLFFLASCKKEAIVTPNQQLALFATNSGSYFITDDVNTEFKIPVGLTKIPDKDIKIEYTVTSSSAVQGQQYSLAGNSITIPAGKTVDSIALKGIFAAYPSGRTDTLVFKITGGDIPSLVGSNVYTIVLQKYCEVDLNALLGDYNNSYDADTDDEYGPYTTTVVSATSTGPTTAKLVIKYAGDYYFGPFKATDPTMATGITVNIDWTDPANFFTTIPTQPMGTVITSTGTNYGMLTISAVGKGSFSSCDNTLSISYKATVSAGSFGNIVTKLSR